jgi:di/tricarboxylate transporter
MASIGCLPLVERGLRLGQPRRVFLSVAIFTAALVSTALGLLSIQIAFMVAAVLMLLTGFMSLREIYGSIDWPVIVLLGAMIPVSRALETTGGAETIGKSLYGLAGNLTPWATLTIVLVITMLLSNVVNNAAAALLMAPVALSIAAGMNVSADPLLMIVAIGASSAFLTPIGHQSNTLVMGPGGYHFGDYWRMGLPLTVIIALVAVPLIMVVWPL